MRRSRLGIKRRQNRINSVIAVIFLVILPIVAVIVGLRITELLVIPTINTDDMLRSPGDIGLVDKILVDKTDDVSNGKDAVQAENKESNTNRINLNSITAYVIQIASLSDSTNIESLIEELNRSQLSHVVYRTDNKYKIYTSGFTKREYAEEKLEEIRILYPDAYISEIYASENLIAYSVPNEENTKAIIEELNHLGVSLNSSSDIIYNLSKKEGNLDDYREVLGEQQKKLEELSKKLEQVSPSSDSQLYSEVKKMVENVEKNINKSNEIINTGQYSHLLHTYFLDSLFRVIETAKKPFL